MSQGEEEALDAIRISLNIQFWKGPIELACTTWRGILCNNDSVITIDLRNSNLSGRMIPSEFGDLPSLSYLNLEDTGLIGSIPPFVIGHPKLQYLDLSLNKLSSSIPESIGFTLAYLFLSHNMLSGTIPDGIGECFLLKTLYLNGNKLTGKVPKSIENLEKLQVLDISDNQLEGQLVVISTITTCIANNNTKLCTPYNNPSCGLSRRCEYGYGITVIGVVVVIIVGLFTTAGVIGIAMLIRHYKNNKKAAGIRMSVSRGKFTQVPDTPIEMQETTSTSSELE